MQRRIRDVLQLGDGTLLVITDDAKGELLKLTPETQR
jgi:glucose/arabinose dehydrogenase